MRKLLSSLGLAFLDPWLLGPLAAFAVAASLFMTWKAVQIRNERIAATSVVQILTRWGDVHCAGLGVKFRPDGEADAAKWGGECDKRAIQLVRFEFDRLFQSNKAANEAIAEQQRKQDADLKAARRDEASRRRDRRNMEMIDAQVPKDGKVGCPWFAGLNVLGGLRRPPGAACAPEPLADGADPAGAVDALRGPVDLPAGS